MKREYSHITIGLALFFVFHPETMQGDDALSKVVFLYPHDATIFPSDFAPPTFIWTGDGAHGESWQVRIDVDAVVGALVESEVIGTKWTPSEDEWQLIVANADDRIIGMTVSSSAGIESKSLPSRGTITFRISSDPVGAPIFYREVNLPFVEAVKDPSQIKWRFGPVSSIEQPPVVLSGLPVCGNCHSFSMDGKTLGLDVDYANDKGSYAIAPVQHDIELAPDDIITWSDFRRDDGELTFGLLSQVSPDGRYVISTVKDRSVFVPRDDLAFSQLFFPIRGILAVYDRVEKRYFALPGADDPTYVQSNPEWSPDGKYIVFARAKAHKLERDRGQVLLTKEECREFLKGGKPFRFDLYRVPFNDGRGGVAEPLSGASNNGMSNFFAKYSPDGRWIVFCKAKNYMLLQPDSELYIIPANGGEARRLTCNTKLMNSWHSWSPNSKWLVFSSKGNTLYTQLFLTHIDGEGNASPPVVLDRFTTARGAANIPEFVNASATAIKRITESFVDDLSYVRSGDAFVRGGDATGAIKSYRMAIGVNSSNVIAHSNLGGQLALQAEELDGERRVAIVREAEEHLRKAIVLDDSISAAHYNLGMLLARRGAVEESMKHLGRAAKLDSTNATILADLGIVYCEMSMFDEGREYLERALALDPGHTEARFALGRLLIRSGDTVMGLTHVREAVNASPDDVSKRVTLAKLLFGSGDQKQALEQIQIAVSQQPESADLHLEFAYALLSASDPAVRNVNKATEQAKRACELSGGASFEPYDLLGVCHAAGRRFDEAIEVAGQALKIAIEQGQEREAMEIQGRIERYKEQRGE